MLPDGTYIIAEWHNNLVKDKCSLKHPNGAHYLGEVESQQFKFHGIGEIRMPNGEYSQGTFENGQFIKGSLLRFDLGPSYNKYDY